MIDNNSFISTDNLTMVIGFDPADAYLNAGTIQCLTPQSGSTNSLPHTVIINDNGGFSTGLPLPSALNPISFAIQGDLSMMSDDIGMSLVTGTDSATFTSPAITFSSIPGDNQSGTYTINSNMLVNGDLSIGYYGASRVTVIVNGNLMIAGSLTLDKTNLIVNGDIISDLNSDCTMDSVSISDGSLVTATGSISLNNFGQGVWIVDSLIKANTINFINNSGQPGVSIGQQDGTKTNKMEAHTIIFKDNISLAGGNNVAIQLNTTTISADNLIFKNNGATNITTATIATDNLTVETVTDGPFITDSPIQCLTPVSGLTNSYPHTVIINDVAGNSTGLPPSSELKNTTSLVVTGDLNITSTGMTLYKGTGASFTSPAITQSDSTYTVNSSMLVNGGLIIGTASDDTDTPIVIINGNLIMNGSLTINPGVTLTVNGDIIADSNTSSNSDFAIMKGIITATGTISLNYFGDQVKIEDATIKAFAINLNNNKIAYITGSSTIQANTIFIKNNGGVPSTEYSIYGLAVGTLIDKSTSIFTDNLTITTSEPYACVAVTGATIQCLTQVFGSTTNLNNYPHIVIINDTAGTSSERLPLSGFYM